MKSKCAVIALTTAAAFWLTTGCGKKEEAAPTAQETQKAVQQAAGEVQKAVEQQVPAMPQAPAVEQAAQQATTTMQVQKAAEQQAPAVQQAAQQVTAAVQQAAASAQQPAAAATPQAGSEAQSLIDKAKGLMADKKWVDALGSLKDAAGKQPTADQKGLLDKLIAEVQKAMTSDAGSQLKGGATKALGGLFGK